MAGMVSSGGGAAAAAVGDRVRRLAEEGGVAVIPARFAKALGGPSL